MPVWLKVRPSWSTPPLVEDTVNPLFLDSLDGWDVILAPEGMRLMTSLPDHRVFWPIFRSLPGPGNGGDGFEISTVRRTTADPSVRSCTVSRTVRFWKTSIFDWFVFWV